MIQLAVFGKAFSSLTHKMRSNDDLLEPVAIVGALLV